VIDKLAPTGIKIDIGGVAAGRGVGEAFGYVSVNAVTVPAQAK
jgi:hypothetical protein